MVQWLRQGASTAGGTGWIPGWGTKIPHATWCDQKTEEKKKVTPLALVGVVLLTADHLQFADAGLELMFAQIDT